jgi:hypothetical protein
VLYEGLPHQTFERELLARELRSQKTVRHHGYPFYQEPLPLSATDAREVTRVFADPASFHAWGGPKTCGGFHPDYCMEWHAGGEVYQSLICFGCREVKVFGPGAQLYLDIDTTAKPRLEAILRSYRKHRPVS